jgi:hypothetical protein
MRACRSCGGLFTPAKSFHRQCWECYWDERDQTRTTPTPAPTSTILDAKTLRDAIRLAHPDLHPAARKDLATATTQKLLAALEVTRQLERAA